MSFSLLPDHELHRLSDEQLIEYIRGTREMGQFAAGRRGLMFLVYGYERDVKRRASLKLPAHLVDDVTHDALVRAIAAAFDGSSSGEFRSWLHTIVDRTIADHYRRAERRPQEAVLPSEHHNEEGVWGAEPSVDSDAGAVELRIVVDEMLDTFSEQHRQVVELACLRGVYRRETCATGSTG